MTKTSNAIREAIMALLVFVGSILVVSLLLFLMFWHFMGLDEESYYSNSSSSAVSNYFYTVAGVGIISVFSALAYFIYGWIDSHNNKRLTKAQHYAERAKQYLVELRLSDDGVGVDFFKDCFLDHMKITNMVERKVVKDMWSDIEHWMLDDSRVHKTAQQKVSGGRHDHKYRYTKPLPSNFPYHHSAHTAASIQQQYPIRRTNQPFVANTGVSPVRSATTAAAAAPAPLPRQKFFGLF